MRGAHGLAARSVIARALSAAAAAAILACGGGARPVDVSRPPRPPFDGGVGTPGDGAVVTPADGAVVALPGPCPDLYADGDLPTFEVEVTAETWAALQQDFALGVEVWRPAVFRHAGDTVADASVRVRGNNSRCGDKLQLAISFDQIDPAGRYHGLRRIDLDHGGCRVLEERLALSVMRDLGLPAACANHARLVVNGAYYGLFLSIEHVNKDFLRRNFGSAADDGNLYKSGWQLKNNTATNDTSDLVPYRAATDVATLAGLADLDEAVIEWGAEAALPARDNYWLHGWNYYLYHHPTRGFLFVPNDLDQAFPSNWPETQLATLRPDPLQHPAEVVLADPAWAGRYEAAVRRARAAIDPDAMAARLDRWWAQVATAAAQDPFLAVAPDNSPAGLEARIRARAAWLDAVLPPAP